MVLICTNKDHNEYIRSNYNNDNTQSVAVVHDSMLLFTLNTCSVIVSRSLSVKPVLHSQALA